MTRSEPPKFTIRVTGPPGEDFEQIKASLNDLFSERSEMWFDEDCPLPDVLIQMVRKP